MARRLIGRWRTGEHENGGLKQVFTLKGRDVESHTQVRGEAQQVGKARVEVWQRLALQL